MTLSECCMQIQPLDETAMQAAQQHWNQLAKPLHSLGRLEDMIVQLAGIPVSYTHLTLPTNSLV